MAPNPDKYRIMVVDDDEDVRLLIKAALQQSYEVVTAHDGLDALEKIDRYEPDFIIMDMVMPLMDGFTACQSIRKLPKFSKVQVLFLSAHGTRENVVKSYESGGNLFLAKPIEPSRLLRNVDLYFQQTPPPVRQKMMTLRQIEMLESPSKARFVTEKEMPAFPEPSASKSERPEPYFPSPEQPSEQLPDVQEGVFALVPRILLVEDDNDLSSLIQMALSEFEIIRAADGMDAIEKLIKFQPDLLIIDVMIPKMNGYQLCQSIRSNAAYTETPIIILTAKTSEKDREYAMKVGANVFLSKPIEMRDLNHCCIGLIQSPEFAIHPKKFSILDIRTQELQESLKRREREEKLRRM